jgi:5'-nucleotidase
VTNDDGVESPGIQALACALHAAGHELLVVAPSGERSGSGAAIGRLHRSGPLACTDVEWPQLAGVTVHAIDATPAAAVYAGCLGAFGPPPDVVASGINPGANTGHLVLHSGTVGAALTAATLGFPALAVSIAWGDSFHWETAATLAALAIDWVAAGVPAAVRGVAPRVLNLNAPNVVLADVAGVREAQLATFAEAWGAERRPGEVVLRYEGHSGDTLTGSDVALVKAGYATVTPLRGITRAEAGSGARAGGDDDGDHDGNDDGRGAAEMIGAALASIGSPP